MAAKRPAEGQDAAEPPATKPRTEEGPAAGDGEAPPPPPKKDTWKEFEETDPLYALLGEVSNYKVMDNKGNFNADLMQKYLEKVFIGSGVGRPAMKKPKDWVEIWAAMDIPVDNQIPALTPIVAYAVVHAPQHLGKILSELLKGHRTKTKTIEEAVKNSMSGMRDDYGVLREMAFNIFPKGPHSEWGWSRVGWSWQQWWGLISATMGALEPSSAFDELILLFEKIEEKGGTPLAKQPMVWNEKRLKTARSTLCAFGGLEDPDDLEACTELAFK